MMEYTRNFNDCSIEENVEFINSLLEQGYSMKSIEKDIYRVSEKCIANKLRSNGYKRLKDGKKLFVLADYTNMMTDNISVMTGSTNIITETTEETTESIEETTENTNMMTVSKNDVAELTKEEIMQLRELLKIKDKLILVNDNDDNNIIKAMKRVKTTDETKQRQFRVNAKVLDDWDRFCGEYSYLKVVDLISLAIEEFINKYKE